MEDRMKVRLGFVSNSSSCSFCIYGIWVDHPDEELRDKAEELRLFCHRDQYGDGLYIGREWSSIGDEETGRMFREDTEKKIEQLPIEDKHCSTHEEGWFDG